MTLVLSLELVKTYRLFFPLVDALRAFRVSRGGAHMCPPPAVRRWLRPPAVRGLRTVVTNLGFLGRGRSPKAG